MNGKVRIYELSKELDLDNKDILAIASRLDIAVKSHSSTIAESEADQIRSAARQSRASGGANRPNAPDRSASRPRPAAPVKNGDRPERKQQILEIRRHRVTPRADTEAVAPTPSTASPSAPAPNASRPARPATDSLSQPPSRPGEASRPAQEVKPKPTVSLNRPEADAPAEAPVEEVETVAVEPTLDVSPPPVKPRPELVGPVSRVRADSDDRQVIVPEGARPPRPVIRRPESRSPESRSPEGRSADGPGAPRPTIPIREIDAGEDVTRLKPKPKLRRPNSDAETARAETAARNETPPGNDSISVLGGGGLDDQPRRPSPPRHKREEREDEDDDQKMREKASKVGKTKRRGQGVLGEDDEDLDVLVDELDEDEEQATDAQNLSISLARPPKPKGAGSGKPSSPTMKSHKPQHRDSSSGGGRSRRGRRGESQPTQERPEFIVLSEGLTVHELAEQIMVPETELIKSLFFKGIAANINQTLDIETAKMVAEEFEVMVETSEVESEAKKVTEMIDAADFESLKRRPPVVTIMGHVDHGKTTLLDSIRKTKVAQGEAGGITQHIGAYHVDVDHAGTSHQIVFLDTPGHEAFTAMRARGTRVTDIAILVVAADDGVRPQTIEAISHAKAAEVPLIVAINKVDKETANPDRVKQELMEHGLVPEEWGGDTIMVPVSALSGENLDNLLEMIVLVSEIEDLQANPDRLARGTVIEANLDKARGPVATLLIQNGTLRVGDSLVAGPILGKVKAMLDDRLKRVQVAGPSFAVEVLGLNDVPAAGDEFEVYSDEKTARAVADKRMLEQRQSRLQQSMASRRVTLNTISAQVQEGDLKDLNLLLKADVQGSIEAILAALQQLPQNEVQIRVLLAAPGEISETDVDLAAASGAVIVGFNTTLAPGARQSADRLGVDVRDYEVIYNLLDDIQGAMEGLLDPEMVEEPLGQVEVRAVFPVRKGAVAGCYVLSGKVTRNCNLRVVRGGEVVYTGKLDSLKRMKEDAKDVASGFECGIGIDNFSDWKEGDIINAFKMVTKRRTLAMA
ncbi:MULTISPECIES: translation initiation factor IF-2 [Cyanophyceae]|nr:MULTISPECIES: translation initiation factor IF-2 [Cyanophyceae]MBD1915797.1 translation initiation factor IF-2 [Phormidium sp. FACHB-77]MBD2030529.1 translation initiation factor IF-2 [Phormidium sp. FACHB-322]MBD2053531.1 translation initiation factor IF-2 [Leptolyngbya sp. FACHB-60]